MVDAPAATDFPLENCPRLRPIDVLPIADGRRRLLMLRDPADPNLEPVFLADGEVEVLSLLDGRRTPEAVSAALQLRGVPRAPAQVRAFLQRLDTAGYLEGPRARQRIEQRASAFRARALRPAVHAGGAYPNSLDELPRFLARGYLHADGPGALPARRDPSRPPPRAIIAPHVDLHRGAPTYSWAYKALAEAQPADLYVVLGTCHTPVEGHFAGLRKPYDTPLGAVPTDIGFLDRLNDRWQNDLFAGELSHAGEHSIEFQAVYLRSLGLAGDNAAPMVAILCDSLHSLVPAGGSPRDVPLVADLVDALADVVRDDGRRITLVAAVDFAHIGRRFGDRWLVDANHQAHVGRGDREMLDLILAGDAEGYYRQVMRDRDARRICGLTPLYVLTALMQGQSGSLLRYTQWVDTDQSSSVTFASALFD